MRRREAVLHADGDVSSLGERNAFILIGVGDVEVGTQGEDPLFHWHLQHQVCVVRHGHKLGEGWVAKDGMVRCVEVGNQEVVVVDAEVLGGAELYR